jgi:hypothetical protein
VPNTHSAAVRSPMTCLRSFSSGNETNGVIDRSAAGQDGQREPGAGHAKSVGVRAAMTGPSASTLESLESRQLLSVSHDAAGWTVVTPGASSRVVYVSSSQGSDNNSGLSQNAPVRSIARGEKLLRSGTGDQLLLKRGDVWHETLGHWKLSGQSSSQPIVIGAYGTGERPRLETGNNIALTAWATSVHDLDIIGVELSAKGRGGGAMPDGIQVIGRMSNLLVEDCKITGYRNNVTLQNFFGPISNVTIRRSVIADSWSSGSHSQGLYAEGVNGITLEEDDFDHNGWRGNSGAKMFDHGAYITATSSGLVARGNVFANSASHGLQARPGGIVENNLFYNNATGLSFGLVNGGGPTKAGGVTGRVDGNVFMGGHNLSGLAAGVGMEISNIRAGAGADVSNNVFADGPPSDNAAIVLGVGKSTVNGNSAVGINNLTIENNVVYKWSRGLSISGSLRPGGRGPFGLNDLVVRNNDFQGIKSYQAVMHFAPFSRTEESWSGNRYDVPGNSKTPLLLGSRGLTVAGWKSSYEPSGQSVRVHYPDAGRTLDRYASDFLARARGLSRQNWDTRYLAASAAAYIKAGFRGGSAVAPPSVPVISVPGKPPTDIKVTPPANSSSPTVSVGDVRTTEGNSGRHGVTFHVRLSKRSTKVVTVRWETKGKTATVGRDYVGQHGTLTFQPGQTDRTVTIQVNGDHTREANEQFALNLLGATNARIADGQGIATVVNDD